MKVFQSIFNSIAGAAAGFCIWNIIYGDGTVVSFMCAGVFIAGLLTNERV